MKITEISFRYKKGLPEYSSVEAGIVAQVGDEEDVELVFGEARELVIRQATLDAEWINEKDKKAARNRAIQRNIERKR
jgi:hypothetical protein